MLLFVMGGQSLYYRILFTAAAKHVVNESAETEQNFANTTTD